MERQYDFSGWATKVNLKCSDGRTILQDAFKHCDGQTVPLVWNHKHENPEDVLGHALLENRPEGVYAYCSFNESESGELAKVLVKHGDITALSIYANQLKQDASKRVMHGVIREVSLVHAGANPGAFIENILVHSEDGEFVCEIEDEAVIYTGEEFSLYHSDIKQKGNDEMNEETKKVYEDGDSEETIADIFNTLSEKQKTAVYAILGQALEDDDSDDDDEAEHSEGGNNYMKHNVFDNSEVTQTDVLTHADQEAIIALAKQSNVGSLKQAMNIYVEEHADSFAHGLNLGDSGTLELLLPDFNNLNPGAPDILRQDQSWVMKVINKIHKSPYSRIRTRQADARVAELKAKGYKKGSEKSIGNSIKLLTRTTDPQTIYIKDELNRDDIIDITDFDVVNYTWSLMKDNFYETLALAALVGDGREDGDPDKIHETHIRSIWNDEELYTIHKDVDLEAAKAELQGSNTSSNFSENYIYAEAMIMAALYAREQYKGTGTPDYYCAPHSVNVMLLARDLNGRRIYDSKADLAKALNVNEIIEIEQLEGKERTDDEGNKKKLHGIFVNLADYQFGSTKGGEVTKFDDFDIDFNKYKYLMEARLSGALTKPYAAIVLEEPVDVVSG